MSTSLTLESLIKTKLILITHRQNQTREEYLSFLEQCLFYGVRCVQIREKNISEQQYEEIAQTVSLFLKKKGICFFVNDHVEIAKRTDADGIHLGQTDISPQEARKIMGPHKIIGLSVSNEEELQKAEEQPIDYIGIGPVFATQNKKDHPPIGLDQLRTFCQKTKHPVVAIGGITEENGSSVFQCGAQGIACINCIHQSKNLKRTIHNLLHSFPTSLEDSTR